MLFFFFLFPPSFATADPHAFDSPHSRLVLYTRIHTLASPIILFFFSRRGVIVYGFCHLFYLPPYYISWSLSHNHFVNVNECTGNYAGIHVYNTILERTLALVPSRRDATLFPLALHVITLASTTLGIDENAP